MSKPGTRRRSGRVRAVRSRCGEQAVDFMTMPASDLLQGYCLGGVPQRVSSHSLESILGPDGQDGEQKLGRQIGGQKRRKVEEGEVVVKAADVAF